MAQQHEEEEPEEVGKGKVEGSRIPSHEEGNRDDGQRQKILEVSKHLQAGLAIVQNL